MRNIIVVSIAVALTTLGAACSSSSDGATDLGGEAKDVAAQDTAAQDAGDDATVGADTIVPANDSVAVDTGATPACDPPCTGLTECIDGKCVQAQVCAPGQWYCNGLTSKKQCNAEGTDFLTSEDCPGDQYCSSGQCGLKCMSDPKFGAYVGCSFWAVDLPTWDDPTMPNVSKLQMAIVVSNPSEMPATLSFAEPPGFSFGFTDLVVPGLSAKAFLLPSFVINGSSISNYGVRLQSDRPVLVHQFNPWDNTFSNDASLLLPEPLLGTEHLVLSWPTDARSLISIPGMPNFGGPSAHGFVTVVATQNDTSVTVRTTARINASEKPPGVDPNTFVPQVAMVPKSGTSSFTLQKGEVLSLDAMPETIMETADLTGTLVLSDKPVAVFSGHDAAAISAPKAVSGDSCCLDHLEEQLLPTNLLGQTYVAGKSASRGGESDLWRVVAAADNVTIQTTPAVSGIHGKTLAKKGDWVEAYTQASFQIDATGPVLVGQYFVAQADTSTGIGDPSLVLAIPVERFRQMYAIMVPPKYDKNYVTILRKPGVSVEVDGTSVSSGEFQSIAGGAWELAWIDVSEGVHTITGAEPFGLSAYGYNSAVSYGYPGGMTIPGEANP